MFFLMSWGVIRMPAWYTNEFMRDLKVINFNRSSVSVFFLVGSMFICALLLGVVIAYATNPYIATLSIVLLEGMAFVWLLLRPDFFSPYTFFSIMYAGYGVGGLYYSFGEKTFGKFILYTGWSDERVISLMEVSLFYVIICHIFFSLGYFLHRGKVLKVANKEVNTRQGFWLFYARTYHFIVIIFLSIGFSWWVYVANETAGGLLNLIIFFQLFPHFAEETGVSTLPYLFYYAGIYLWLLGIAVEKRRVSWLFILSAFVGCLINLTQGRITLSITFLLSLPIFFALWTEHSKKKALMVLPIAVLVAFAIYFLRILSNYFYIGETFSSSHGSFVGEFMFQLVGSGNIADLQQLVLIIPTFFLGEQMFGLTYFDVFINIFSGTLGLEPTSVGHRIHDTYFPGADGVPTPGAIGEAYVNFSYAGAVFMFFIGWWFHWIYKILLRTNNPVVTLVYVVFLLRFVLMYAKVDSTMLANFFFGVAPLVMTLGVMYVVYKLLSFPSRSGLFKKRYD